MNIKHLLLTGIALFALSLPVSAEWYETDEHGNNRESGSYTTGPIFVQCLNDGAGDYVTFNVNWDVVVHTTNDFASASPRWMFSQNWRQSGTAHDTSGNEWTWRGHFSAIEVNEFADWTQFENFHSIEKDILRSRTAPNLIFTWVRVIKWMNGVQTVFIRDSSAKCL